MIIKTEINSFDEFHPWSGGKDTLESLSRKQQECLFQYAEEIFPEGCTDTELNDWLWFDRDSIYDYLKIDENGNDIGSTEWARPILMKYAESLYSVGQFGNIYNIVTCFLDEEYCEECENEDDLKYEFNRYVLSKWKEHIKQQLMAWHSDFGAELIVEWIDENYDNEENIPDCDDAIAEFDKYIESLNELEEE